MLVEGEPTVIGALADSVEEVIDLEARIAHLPQNRHARSEPDSSRASGKRDAQFIMILDIDRVFSARKLLAVRASGNCRLTGGVGLEQMDVVNPIRVKPNEEGHGEVAAFYDLKIGTKLLSQLCRGAGHCGAHRLGWGAGADIGIGTRSASLYYDKLVVPIRDLGYANAAFLTARTEIRSMLGVKDKAKRKEFVAIIDSETKKTEAYIRVL